MYLDMCACVCGTFLYIIYLFSAELLQAWIYSKDRLTAAT